MLIFSNTASAYSVLSHEAVIDSAWDEHLKPALLAQFPQTTEDQLTEAHAYAYGGCLIQDMGYYPFGSKFFTDLVHYIRSGDLILAMIEDARDVNEYAFALGAMAHYCSDISGHSIGVNPSVASLYPRDTARHHGDSTYDACPQEHLRVEFGFDVLQVARGNYTSKSYHDFIGFKVSKRVLESAFRKTYGLELKDVFGDLDLAIGSYRYAVSQLIPQLTRVAWEIKKDAIQKVNPALKQEKFLYALTPAEYQKEWGDRYMRPGPVSKTFALLFRIIPRVGPASALHFKALRPEEEKMMAASFEDSLSRYSKLLDEARTRRPALPNMNLDLGEPPAPGAYRLSDRAFAQLVEKLKKDKFRHATAEVRDALLAFCADDAAAAKLRLKWTDRGSFRRAFAALRAAQFQAGSSP